jgi:putative oxidoreductase
MQTFETMDSRLCEFQVVDNKSGFLTFAGRVFMSAIFLVSAYMLLTDWNGMKFMLTEHGLGQIAPVLMGASLFCELLGGLSLLFGFFTRAGALLLTVYLIVVTLVLNNFWDYPLGEQPMQIVMCLKNLAILGGLLNIIVSGPGPWSIDFKRMIDPRMARTRNLSMILRQIHIEFSE